MTEPTRPQTFDEFVDAEVDRAMARWRHLIPTPDFLELREVVRAEMVAHAVTRQMLQQLAPRPVQNESGDVDARTYAPVVALLKKPEKGGNK